MWQGEFAGREVLVKLLHTTLRKLSTKAVQDFENEVKSLRFFRHR
jgi:hypothetical protein